jgi:methionyl-tRNA formyltransferase
MIRVAFAGDRQSGVDCLAILLEAGVQPLALMVSAPDRASHAHVLREMTGLDSELVFAGRQFRETEAIERLRSLELDYIIGVHFPYIFPDSVLEIPRVGVLNLHPGLLPHNRGWHTPSWAILDQTPIGATLHFMDSGLDTGDIVAQVAIEVRPEDTAHTLYGRLLQVEVDLFREAWPLLATGNPPRRTQSPDEGTSHSRADLAVESVGRLDLEQQMRVEDVLRTLRALTTNSVEEAAYFEVDGRRYHVQVTITPEDEDI